MKPNRHEICIGIGFCIGIVNESGVITNKWYQSRAVCHNSWLPFCLPVHRQTAPSVCQSSRMQCMRYSSIYLRLFLLKFLNYLTLICILVKYALCVLSIFFLLCLRPYSCHCEDIYLALLSHFVEKSYTTGYSGDYCRLPSAIPLKSHVAVNITRLLEP